ncbi:Tetrapyrrole methylase [Moorella glycerini]|uniref:Nucleoside triphosphate pyrophosphohydrolase n=1 Tax=Neomoorella stamsii TaxID=1266720 RepID=A0A9X7P4L1_9FIRM|nr:MULTISPECIES: nucleoside triphosphate pyrophosphohydrolase [Moorella]PRR68740.1 Nucleoside triphosphate pyrophosphohydrolase [Moorella stamsii]CEP68386.1 Tetrapyrrole methylase [Moorella glycerini]
MAGKVIIAGMGPGDPAQVPPAVLAALPGVDKIYLRTARHPAVAALKERGLQWESFDSYYEQAGDFEELYRRIVATLLGEARDKELAYVVPGHPLVAERSVTMLLEAAPGAGVDTRVIPAMSCLDALYATLHLDPTRGLTVTDALTFTLDGLDPGLGLILTQVYNQRIASDTKLTLMGLYPDEYPVTVVRGAGLAGEERVATVPLYAIDRLPWIDHLTSIYLPPYPEGRDRTLAGLKAIMARLRGEGGCPWDREQTHQSLKRYLIEESYEVLEAIDIGDMHKLCEELGDLLLQVVFHARLAEENGDFTLADCLEAICAKMRRRHPHVFATAILNTAGEVLARWDQIKAAEKKSNGEGEPSVLSVPRGLPALMKALKVQEQAARVGFDWSDVTGVWAKVEEELEELKEAVAGEERREQAAEVGDVLFALVNLARWLGVEPEAALQATVAKFMQRFQYIERKARQKGLDIKGLSLAEMDALWEEAKKIPGR